jgi:hypothetical protein
MAMNQFTFPRGNGVWFAVTLAGLALVAYPLPGIAAERAVLGEEFTATW